MFTSCAQHCLYYKIIDKTCIIIRLRKGEGYRTDCSNSQTACFLSSQLFIHNHINQLLLSVFCHDTNPAFRNTLCDKPWHAASNKEQMNPIENLIFKHNCFTQIIITWDILCNIGLDKKSCHPLTEDTLGLWYWYLCEQSHMQQVMFEVLILMSD